MSTTKRTLRGAIVAVSKLIPVPRVLAFQYNPASVRRTLTPRMRGGSEISRSTGVQYAGPPVEQVTVELEIDAADDFPSPAPFLSSRGIEPTLAALEMLLYPGSARVVANQLLLAVGTIEIAPYTYPTVLFVWGPHRVMPVMITSYEVVEEAFDANLNPLRAQITLSLQVLTWADLPPSDPGFALYMAYQVSKEASGAAAGAAGTASALIGAIKGLAG